MFELCMLLNWLRFFFTWLPNWGEGLHYTNCPETVLLLCGAHFKPDRPLFLPSAIHQDSSSYSVGSAMTDGQFKWGDDLLFLQTAIELFDSVFKTENWTTRFRQEGKRVLKEEHWALCLPLHWSNLSASESKCKLTPFLCIGVSLAKVMFC